MVGAFGCPTVINNVETLCCVPHIVERGADWFKSIGTDERNTGPKLYAVSGHVERPGTYELPIGVTFDELLQTAGGVYRGRELKAFIPGGASAVMLPAAQRHLRLDFDTLAKAGSMLGSAAVVVLDETACVVRAAERLVEFFAHESCGQCTPCREGTHWGELVLRRIERGEGTARDLEILDRLARNLSGTALCALADACVGPLLSMTRNFRDELEEHVRRGACPLPPRPWFGDGPGDGAAG
jgi:NADH-quinone oxidoreductase subunit F